VIERHFGYDMLSSSVTEEYDHAGSSESYPDAP
jgi:hypothetical protein